MASVTNYMTIILGARESGPRLREVVAYGKITKISAKLN